jgi:predicted RNA binding protein with dsRBD fold (UPF0201 family)
LSEAKVVIRAEVNPTEDPEKVAKAIMNVFGPIALETIERRGGTTIEARMTGIESLRHLRDSLARERIRDAVRRMLSHWASDEAELSFGINRQAAYAGHVSIYQASHTPLGPIQVTVKGDPGAVISYLCGVSHT